MYKIAPTMNVASNILTINKLVEQAEIDQLSRLHYLNDAEVIQYYLDNHDQLFKERGRAENTLKVYEAELTQFIQHLIQYGEIIGLTDLTIHSNSLFKSLMPRHIKKYQRWLAEESPYVQKQRAKGKNGYSVATLSRKTVILKQFFKFLEKHNYITESLSTAFLAIEVTDHDRPNRDMSTKDVVRLLAVFIKIKNITAFMLVQLLVSTGIRNNELCTLRISDLKCGLQGDYYLEVLGKGNKRRNVPLRTNVYASINYYRLAKGFKKIDLAQADEPLIPTSRGNAFTPPQLVKLLKRQLEAAQQHVDFPITQITPHVFRHAFAIISHENGANIYDIMRSLGHERIETTQIYLEKIYQQEQHTLHMWKNEINEYL